MKGIFISAMLLFGLVAFSGAQTTTMVILNDQEISRLRAVAKENAEVQELADSIIALAEEALMRQPRPLEIVYYEGLLDTDPRRIDTENSFLDIDATVNLIYASYLADDLSYGSKAVKFATSWAKKYRPTGNPINENKFVAFYWTYYLFNDQFSAHDRKIMKNWMRAIARAEMDRDHTPNNNWQSKRLKMIGIIGCILKDRKLQQFSIDGWKDYINTAYFADGTSRDLRQRDALHYHLSGIKPALSVFINLSGFNTDFDLYDNVGEDGGSIKKSVEFSVPYATGEKQHEEWVNTQVRLDKERAAAGLEEYQPGMLFEPEKAKPVFEWAVYYNTAWYSILSDDSGYASSWVGLLNSPWIRK